MLGLSAPSSLPTSLQYHLDYCSMYTDHSVCSRDPECSWCQGACQAAPPPGTPSGAVSDCPRPLSPAQDLVLSVFFCLNQVETDFAALGRLIFTLEMGIPDP